MSWATCYSGSNNIHFDFPAIMSDGRNFATWQPGNVISEKIREEVNIKTNWNYFKLLYSINSHLYRNDIAFSIAIHIMNGKTDGTFAVKLPGKMSYILDKDILVSTDIDKMKFLVEKENYLGEYTLVKTTGIDVHVMNKSSLSRYIDGGSGV